MSPAPDHLLERRARLLATQIGERTQIARDAVAPPGSRPPFTVQQPRAQVLDWWRAHIDDDLGKQVLARLSPQDVMDLHVALARRVEADPQFPPEEMGAGIDQSLPPPGTTPMPPSPGPPGPMPPQPGSSGPIPY